MLSTLGLLYDLKWMKASSWGVYGVTWQHFKATLRQPNMCGQGQLR